ncbi:MAG TPA: allophanate hydrolase [Actinocrinis sp.]|nr:allophanate hydrolase [Actinocrinis sp.]
MAAEADTENQPQWIRRLSEAERADLVDAARRDAGAASPGPGPLAGIRFAVKDNIDVAGVPSTAGFPPAAAPAAASATAVRRLLAAGAVPVGKTNLDQFATGLVGTRSPYGSCHAVGHDLYVSGGSSSGSAVAVAGGEVELALGTDTAGSGRVPAAFNGIVGLKPTRGLVSTAGVVPACPTLDCVSVFTRTVAQARTALGVLAGYDPADPYSRAKPAHLPLIATEPRVVAVPAGPIDLDPLHREAWEAALAHARKVADEVVEVDVEPFLEAARLLYQGPWLVERYRAVAALLGDAGLDHPDLDPAVRQVLAGAGAVSAADVFAGFERLAVLRRASEAVWDVADALLLPVTPNHPTLAEVAADPVPVNSRLGTYTNFVNLLDLCAVAVPAGSRADGLPFGVQLIAPAFADGPLLDLAAQWTGEAAGAPQPTPTPPGWTQLAVAGAHLSGMALNHQLLGLGARLRRRTRTAPDYRLFRLPGQGPARPGLYRSGPQVQPTGPDAGPPGGIGVEIWELTHQAVGALLDTVPAPLGFGRLALADGGDVLGFVAQGPVPDGALNITRFGGWRAYIASWG